MKKFILIFSLIVSVLGIFIVAIPSILKITGADRPVKEYLFKKIIDDHNIKIDLADFRIGLGSVELSNLSVDTRNQKIHVRIKSVRFFYDLFDLLIHPHEPLHALNSIALIEPQVLFTQDTVAVIQDSTSRMEKIKQFVQRVAGERGLSFFKVERAVIALKKPDKKVITLVNNLSGFLKTDDFNLFKLKLEGDLLGSQLQKINLTSELNLAQKKLEIFNAFNQFRFSQSELSSVFPQLSSSSGVLNGWLLIRNVDGAYDRLNCNGQIRFTDGVLELNKAKFSSLSGKAIFTDNRLILDSLRGKLNKASLSGVVQVSDIFNPQVVGRLKLEKLTFADLLGPSEILGQNQATLASVLEFNFNPQNKTLEINGDRGKLRVPGGLVLNNLKFNLVSTPQKMTLRGVEAFLPKNGVIKARAFTDKKTGITDFNILASQLNGRHVIFDRLSNKRHTLSLTGRYNHQNQNVTGLWQYALHDSSDSLFAVKGAFFGNSREVKVRVNYSNKPSFSAFVHISDLFRNWKIESGFVKNFPFERLTSIELLHDFLNETLTEFRLSGSLKQNIRSKITLMNKRKPGDRIEIQSSITKLFAGNFAVDGLCKIKNIEGELHFSLFPDKFNGSFNFSNQLLGEINMDLTKSEYLSGKILFNDFRIIKALADSLKEDDLRALASLNGRLTLGGDLDNPRLMGEISGDRFIFNDIGYYQGNLKFDANKEFIKLDSLLIAINNLPVIQGKGFADIKNDSVNAFFNANDVDIEQLLVSVFNRNPHLSGSANYSLYLHGALKKPKVELDLKIFNGYLDRIPFDQLSLLVKNEYINGSSILDLENQRMLFDRFDLIKRDEYALNALGEIPFDPTKNIDFFVNFKGDLLGLIPFYQPFIEKARSDVEFHLAIGGSPDRIRISSGYFLINDGEMWLRNVARHVSHISGVIEKKGGTNQVNFINLSAETGGETLTINTARNVRLTDGRVLAPWYLKNLDLDFGVLKMTTSGKGVRLHIPGLMRKGEEGRMYLTGMNDKEDFYFAGPLKHPVVHGKVVLYDTRLTFPFIVENKPGQKPSVVVNFLENINWDVLAVSGEDVLYFREIPAYIDNVNTELYIDESSPGLHFSGILNEGTFKVAGRISSSRGRLEYLDQTFRVDYFQAEFNENSLYPVISGQAWTTIRDSIGAVPKTIYLKLYAIDEETQQEKQQGSWENFKFKLVSADPKIGESQEQVLADLGFSVGNIADKVTSVGGAVTEKYIFRPLFRPLERVIERNLGIDMVRFNSNIARNLFYSSIGFGRSEFNRSTPLINPFNTETPYLFLMQSSEITLGKYLTQNLFLTYTGQLVSVYDQSRPSFDINHSFGIEYRFFRNILLEIEYDRELMGYYKIQNQKQYLEDIKIRLRHSFTF
ncbi:hypothetical protein Calab_3668 [Caldithrix abyssi DSM 13497]|uniref:Autotransporter translocation and assembly factor TamB n=1 Tax=Caldithrix abyssi DSM 13497 TaxID=880073 RepID=H1XNM8_CALAY|nr:hypothetical protein [Caldithrix abyssi]APF19364.1 hypothetical protein Cabys_2615 [Caldithrix abyssi DSM 13497]EHO43266.1 hypothetical protein Calab_3668 [Caldithrix abyssi DSM 13497]